LENYHGIPIKTYKELCALMGDEEAGKYLRKRNYSFGAATKKIFILNTINYAKKNNIKFIIIVLAILLLVFGYFYYELY